jgi:diguanylate cyclase (GGDEF)-like protein
LLTDRLLKTFRLSAEILGDMDEHRRRLGDALIERADDVAVAVIKRVWPEGTDEVDGDVLEAIAETDRAAARLIGLWLTGGTHIDEEERRGLGALGGMLESISLDALVKAYLAWRDAMLAIVDEEAAALGTPPELVAEIRAVIARNNDGSVVRMARSFEQERQRLHQLLAERALHDGLTGLPNRVLLFDRIEHALGLATRSERPLALLFIDLDGFKAVNDRLGHHAGDQLLVAVAARICEAVRKADTVARLGGDEFVVLCEELVDAHHPIRIAERVIAGLNQPFALGGGSISISASVGVAATGGSDSADELLMRADIAMYAAKQQGPGRYEISKRTLLEAAVHSTPA